MIRFKEDLLKQPREQKDQCERLIMCIDVNEDIYRKSIVKFFTDSGGLGMVEAVGEFTSKKTGVTLFRKKQTYRRGLGHTRRYRYRIMCYAYWVHGMGLQDICS